MKIPRDTRDTQSIIRVHNDMSNYWDRYDENENKDEEIAPKTSESTNYWDKYEEPKEK